MDALKKEFITERSRCETFFDTYIEVSTILFDNHYKMAKCYTLLVHNTEVKGHLEKPQFLLNYAIRQI